MDTPAKKRKMPLDYVLRSLHDAMELVFEYYYDPNYIPSADDLVLFEALHKQIVGYVAMSMIIIPEMRKRIADSGG
ncbi:MAG TPA: hypothetical protein VH933_07135 [Aestuariivirgaceae bacterium]|jgi:hypothetical protein